jgi:hypothetical protein
MRVLTNEHRARESLKRSATLRRSKGMRTLLIAVLTVGIFAFRRDRHSVEGPRAPRAVGLRLGPIPSRTMGTCDGSVISTPHSLRRWFVAHFAADILFALPLFLAPRAFLGALGWTTVDPLATRLVAAALFGVGIQSLLGRNESVETFRATLNLKIIWSASATLGILWSQLEGGPAFGWAFVGVFAVFNGIWSYYRWILRGPADNGVSSAECTDAAVGGRTMRTSECAIAPPSRQSS